MNLYNQIFKRKSFHLFKNTEVINDEELKKIKSYIKNIKPLDMNIKIDICIVEENETTCKRGGQYCILFYSEINGEYLRNIGYIGEQIDLYLASQNIGTLWYGIGKTERKQVNGLDFVIMMSIAKVSEDMFRKDMFKAKRKTIEEIWRGQLLSFTSIIRFSPSACNGQPWFVENINDKLKIYRYRKKGKRGIMPSDKVTYYNRIDMGIFLCILEICLEHDGYSYERKLFVDKSDDNIEFTLVAEYAYLKMKIIDKI